MFQSEWIAPQTVASLVGLLIAVASILLTYFVARKRQNFELRRAHTNEIRDALKAWNPHPAKGDLITISKPEGIKHLISGRDELRKDQLALLTDFFEHPVPDDVSLMADHYKEYLLKKRQMVDDY